MNSSIVIELDGIKVNGRIDGTENFTITLRRRDEGGSLSRSYSSELTFYDDGYAYIKSKLIDPVGGFSQQVNVNIYDDCCNKLVFEGIIYGDKIDWCEPKCSVSVNIIERDPVFNCIQSKLIYDNQYGFLNINRDRLVYCIEHRPIFMHVLLLTIGAMLKTIVQIIAFILWLIFTVILGIIYAICRIINAIGANLSCADVSPTILWDILVSLNDTLQAALDPCSSFHPVAYVRDYINNVCKICNLNFKSSILNDPAGRVGKIYYKLALLSNMIKRGRSINNNDSTLIEDNLPIETVETLFDRYLKPMFNADYQIIGNDLVFERKDYFYTLTPWIDTEELLENGLIENDEICYSWLDKERWAYAVYKYTPDGQEYIGNEALGRYNDIIEWNNPYSPTQKKGYEFTQASSPIRTMKDGCEQNVYQEIGQNVLTQVTHWNHVHLDPVILAQHTAFNYKFILMDEFIPGFVTKYYPDSFVYLGVPIGDIPPEDQRVNYPLWFKEGIDQVSGHQNNLYSLFHYIDNPRNADAVQYSFKFTFKFNCDQYNAFDYYKSVRLIRGGQVKYGKIDEISVDFTKRTINVIGKVN